MPFQQMDGSRSNVRTVVGVEDHGGPGVLGVKVVQGLGIESEVMDRDMVRGQSDGRVHQTGVKGIYK